MFNLLIVNQLTNFTQQTTAFSTTRRYEDSNQLPSNKALCKVSFQTRRLHRGLLGTAHLKNVETFSPCNEKFLEETSTFPDLDYIVELFQF